ncbi:CP family cyanate transporter-like MFS transporter [Gracilibacillus halotolerans]|uniref:CP family cyanate transporter-like MFS transporter n=1 Tax=Gracilibacillus halotolerans TaxID=74386 RepID=A0A841RNH3_9BACI|nr:MFS transporter [Gracilibacillus halotolerans]MBB6513153.1 CP family cyanate transporter-like MFS transporter [Gracilibacillus halotolerans]
MNKKKYSLVLFIIGIILISFNLRPAITAVGPIITTIRDSVGLHTSIVGLMTSLPLLAFAVMSPIAPRLANRLGNEKTLLYGLVILLSGILIRSLPPTILLFIGTILIGVGIAIMNVLLPSLIKSKFPNLIGPMTGVYTTAMSGFAAIGSGLSVPLTEGVGLGWRWSLASWGVLAVIAIIIWVFVLRGTKTEQTVEVYEPNALKLLKSRVAWQVTLFMGLQSFLFYVTISWLAEILIADGFSPTTAGWYVAYMQLISLPATFFTPIIASRLKKQHIIVWIFSLSGIIGYIGLLFENNTVVTTIWVTLIGILLGSSISLALAFLGLRTVNPYQAAELSGMAQSFGYLLAATGPFLIGLIFDITASWNTAIIVIIVVSVLTLIFGLGASRDKYVLEEKTNS